MCELLDGPPRFECKDGIVFRVVELDGRRTYKDAMRLSDFVIAAKDAHRLAQQWVAETRVVRMGPHAEH